MGPWMTLRKYIQSSKFPSHTINNDFINFILVYCNTPPYSEKIMDLMDRLFGGYRIGCMVVSRA